MGTGFIKHLKSLRTVRVYQLLRELNSFEIGKMLSKDPKSMSLRSLGHMNIFVNVVLDAFWTCDKRTAKN